MNKISIKYFFALLSLVYLGCINPVEPEFEFKEGLVFIEGIATTVKGGSYVIINKSVNEFGINKTKFEKGASVSFVNSVSGQTVELVELEGAYVPSIEFKANVGEQWEIQITLEDGRQYYSQSETVLESVPITNIKATYNPELQFNNGTGSFEPGHAVSITFNDPISEENYYYWTFKSYENLLICQVCFDGIYRGGLCGPTDIATPDYFSYTCDTDCWKVRYPESISIFDDKFSDGKTTTDLIVANVPLYTKENIVVEIQQLSLTPDAYDYYKVLKDLVDNSSGFNAPPPAALIGNMFNPNDADDFVFGRFTAAATSTIDIFIERGNIPENQLDPQMPMSIEPTFMSPYPAPATIEAPCNESRFKTAIQPEVWMN
ncbi:DUF4249 domain-containing protein [Maribacter sp. ACAM166]|uniref:DUF4249 domain-containing protein n=1 Tax=Maribacter sp. ACAM166 TaxID=2508996 RepID=UPI0010FD7F1A|nr:DUF4249 domain-containing protein [Maribacter sp. ACAM166]TLP82301.1 DUF4249 domain-containing protein [Maribacter sp. ACAM166]